LSRSIASHRIACLNCLDPQGALDSDVAGGDGRVQAPPQAVDVLETAATRMMTRVVTITKHGVLRTQMLAWSL